MDNLHDAHDNRSLSSKVFKYVRLGIIEGRYKSGDFLIETRLASELGVSRTPVREALRQLELEDLVECIPNRGVIVKGISSEDIDDIYTIRLQLEGLAAYWASQRIKPSQLNRLEEIIELMELYTRRNNSTNLARLDTEFHEIIFTAANSRSLKHILVWLHQNIQYARQSSLMSPSRTPKSFEEHKMIFTALETGEADLAKAYMERHITAAHSHPEEPLLDS